MAIVCMAALYQGEEVAGTAGTVTVVAPIRSVGLGAIRCHPTTTGTGWFSLNGRSATTGAAADLNAADMYFTGVAQIDTIPSADSEALFQVVNGTTTQKLLGRLNAAGTVSLYDQAGVLIGTGSTVLSAGVNYRYGIRAGNGASANYDFKIAAETVAFGASELSGTADLGATNVDKIRLGKVANVSGRTVDYTFQDWLADTTQFHDNFHIGVALPNAAGTDTDGTGAYTDCDDYPHDSDTTYWLGDTFGQVVTFGMESFADIGGTGTTILGVAANNIKKRVVGAEASRVRIRSGGSAFETSNLNTSVGYTLVQKHYLTDPFTSAAWTTSGIDALQVGANHQGINGMRLTQVSAFVVFTPSTGNRRRRIFMGGH